MKCPSCGVENPAFATICQCGYSFPKKTPAQERSSRFLSFCIELYVMFRKPWPHIVDLKTAELASKQGVWAAGVLLVLSLIFLDTGTSGTSFEGWEWTTLLDGLTFGLIAWGIHRKSRAASVLGFSFYLLEQLLSVLDGEGINGGITIIFFVIAFGNSIRGTFAYHKFHTQLRSVIDPETGLPTSIPELPSLPMPVKLLGGFVVAGFVMLLLSGLLMGPVVVLEGDQLSADQISKIESLMILEPDEKIQYFYSWGWEGFSMLTDRSLIIYWSANEPTYKAPLQDIISISVDYGDSFLEDSQVHVQVIDRELMEQLQPPLELDFFLSPEDEGDRKFIRALEEGTGVNSTVFERADSVD